jgi:hypothetical protein
MGKNMKKSRKHMWGGKWFGLVADDTAVASGTTANANANADNATDEKPGFFAGLLGSKTDEQKVVENKTKITELLAENKVLEDKKNSQNNNQVNTATGSTTGETGSATTGETGSTSTIDPTQKGGKRSRRRRGRKTKKSRRSRRHR